MTIGKNTFKPFTFDSSGGLMRQEDKQEEQEECNTTLYEQVKELMDKQEIPEWVHYYRMDDDGRNIGFEKKPYYKHGVWQGGGRWVQMIK